MARAGGYKRKDLDLDFALDDFSDFSLSAPALKIRRLDADSLPLPPIIEEEDAGVAPVVSMEESVSPMSSGETENLERALVVFKPANSRPPYYWPSNLSVALDSGVLSGLTRDQFLRSEMIQVEDDEEESGNISAANGRDGCKAVVPWVSSSRHSFGKQVRDSQDEAAESMAADETGLASMDVEENDGHGNIEQGRHFGSFGEDGGLRQWQQHQQHCFIPELPPNNLTPVTWLR